MLFEERANILSQLPVIGLAGGVQSSDSLLMSMSYLMASDDVPRLLTAGQVRK